MGLFNRYTKEGKGVTKEEAGKRKYFEILIGRFWDLVKVNLLYATCNIPMIIACVLLAIPLWFNTENIDMYIRQIAQGNIIVVIWLVLPLAPFILSGPFTAGLTYITRNYSSREHVFMVSDFFEHAKKNIKQSLVMNVISFIAFFLYSSAGMFYYVTSGGSVFIMALFAVLGVMLCAVNFYTYPMIISFDMRLSDIIKNACIFALSKLPQNLFYLVIILAVHIGLWMAKGVLIIAMPLITVAWTSFTINYYAWHIIKKFMLPDKEEDKKETVFEDEIKEIK